MGRGMARAARLDEMTRLYLQRAYSDIGMAERLSTPEHRVDRTTVFRDRSELETDLPFDQDDEGRYYINRDRYLPHIRVNLCEALSLYLAARHASQQTHSAQKHTANALEKLALVLKQPMTQRLVKAADVILQQKADPARDKVFETVADAWVRGLRLRVHYQGLHASEPYQDLISPYLIEPSPWSDSVYVIGPSDKLGKIVPYKLDRIQRATLSSEPFTLPEDFNEQELLRHAWGIWYSDDPPVEVTLRFHPRVALRVRETRWHPSQQIEEQADGYLLWRARVAEVQEMLPWVRGWGADVEVVEPAGLREKISEEAQHLARVYNVSLNNSVEEKGGYPMNIFQQFLTLPGKTEPRLTIFEHSSDVFHVALYLLSHNQASVNNPSLVKSGALLHDVGKIAQDIQVGKQWNHQPHSAKYLQSLLEHPRMKALLKDNAVEMDQVKYEDLLLICEHHHDLPTQPALLRRCPEALLVSVADVLASSLESGWLGDIRTMLTTNTYTNLSLALLENLGLADGLDGEIHRVDLPGDSVADALLNDLIFRDMSKQIANLGLEPILQKGGSLWVVGDPRRLRSFLEGYLVNPRTLYESAELADEIYDGVLAAMPAPGSVQMDSIKYLLVNEKIARKVMLGLIDRKRVRQALEHFNISPQRAHETFGVRGRMVVNKLEAIGESPRYLLTGAQAAYHYHRWRTPSAGDYELLIVPEDFDTWYSYLRDAHIFAGKVLPTQTERKSYLEAVILIPELNEELWHDRFLVDDIAYIAPTDLLFRLAAKQTDEAMGEVLAIITARRQNWNWDGLVGTIKTRRMARQFGCLFEVLNREAHQPIVPAHVVESLQAVVHDTVGEALFPFPLHANQGLLPSSRAIAEYATIGKRWGLDLLLPRHLVAKVLEDLGA